MTETNDKTNQPACNHAWITDSNLLEGNRIPVCRKCGISADKIQCEHNWEWHWSGHYDDYESNDSEYTCSRCHLRKDQVKRLEPPPSVIWSILLLLIFLLFLVSVFFLCNWLR